MIQKLELSCSKNLRQMRIFSKIPTVLLIVSALFISCSSDDGPSGPDPRDEAVGTYTLTALNVNPAQDVNEDGTASTNLLDEMICITGTLTLNADTSWNLNVIRINVTTITGGQFFIACGDADVSTGNWTISNGQVSLNGGFEPTIYTLSNNMLTRQIGEDLPGFQSAVFTK